MMSRKSRLNPVLLARTALSGAVLLLATSAATAQSTVAGTIGSTTGNGAGSTIVDTAGSTSTVVLGNSRTILDWNGNFNLGSGSTLNYVFGGRGDIVLNRVDNG